MDSSTNDQQDDDIEHLQNDTAECKELFLANLNASIIHLEDKQEVTDDKINDLAEFVASRKCEYKLRGHLHKQTFPAGYDIAFTLGCPETDASCVWRSL